MTNPNSYWGNGSLGAPGHGICAVPSHLSSGPGCRVAAPAMAIPRSQPRPICRPRICPGCRHHLNQSQPSINIKSTSTNINHSSDQHQSTTPKVRHPAAKIHLCRFHCLCESPGQPLRLKLHELGTTPWLNHLNPLALTLAASLPLHCHFTLICFSCFYIVCSTQSPKLSPNQNPVEDVEGSCHKPMVPLVPMAPWPWWYQLQRLCFGQALWWQPADAQWCRIFGWLYSPTKCIKHALIQVMLINSQDKFNIVQALRRSIGAASAYSRRLKVTKTKVSRSECLMLMSSIAPYLHGTARYATFDSNFEPIHAWQPWGFRAVAWSTLLPPRRVWCL